MSTDKYGLSVIAVEGGDRLQDDEGSAWGLATPNDDEGGVCLACREPMEPGVEAFLCLELEDGTPVYPARYGDPNYWLHDECAEGVHLADLVEDSGNDC